jgi:hypothetical protein
MFGQTIGFFPSSAATLLHGRKSICFRSVSVLPHFCVVLMQVTCDPAAEAFKCRVHTYRAKLVVESNLADDMQFSAE